MDQSNLKPIHPKVHSLPCTCPVNSSVADSTPCFLWIRKPDNPDKIITFNSITAAFAYGERCIINDDAQTLVSGTDVYDQDTVWSFDNGIIYWANIDWYWSLCCILSDVLINVRPTSGVWPIMRSSAQFMSIGIGSDLTEIQRTGCPIEGYTLESYDTLGDIPPLIWTSSLLG
jgi:hypothetical protein